MGSFQELLTGVLAGWGSLNSGDMLLGTFLGSVEAFFP